MLVENLYVEMIEALCKSRRWSDRNLAMLASVGRTDVPMRLIGLAMFDKDERVCRAAELASEGRELPYWVVEELEKRARETKVL